MPAPMPHAPPPGEQPQGASGSAPSRGLRASARRHSRDGVCLLALLLFACAVAWPIFGGGVPVATDTLSLWPPQAVAEPRPVNNPDLADSALLYLPWQLFIRRSLEGGEWPLWNPNFFAGYPFAGIPQNQLYYPVAWLLWLVPLPLAMQLNVLIHLWLAGAGMYLFGRVLGAGRPGALLGGLAFAASGQLYMGLEFPFSSNIYVWLPWVVAAAELSWRRRSWAWAALAGLLFGVLAVAGNPQWFVYGAAFLALWLGARLLGRGLDLIRERKADRAAWRLSMAQSLRAVAILLWGPALAMVHFLPVAELAGLSTRLGAAGLPVGPDQLDRTIRLLARQLHLFVPQFFGTSAPRIGNPLGVDNCWYIGLAPLALAIVALLLRRERRVLLLGAAAVTGFGVAAQLPFFNQLHQLPGLQAQIPQRSAYLFIFAGAALGGLGFDALLGLARRRPAGALIIAAAVMLAGLAIGALLLERHAQTADRPALHSLQAAALGQAGLMFALFIAWLLAVVVLRGGRLPWAGAGLAAFLLGAVALDMLTYAPGYNTYVAPETLRPQAPSARALSADEGLWRMIGVDTGGPVFVPNSPALYAAGFHDVRGYESLHLAAYEDYWAAVEPEIRAGGYFNVLLSPRSYWSRQADLLNVRYVVAAAPLTGTRALELRRVHESLPDAALYVNPDAFARAFVVAGAEFLPPAEIPARLADPDFDPAGTVLLAGTPGLAGGETAAGGPAGRARMTAYRNLSVEVEAEMERGGWLVLADASYPGWEATVDGEPASVRTAYGILRAVPLTAGTHQVSFNFRPRSVAIGGAISLLALGAALAIICASLARRLRRRSATAAPGSGNRASPVGTALLVESRCVIRDA